MHPALGLVDHDGDHEARTRRGNDPDETRHGIVDIAAVLHFVCSAGLPGHRIPRDLHDRGRAAAAHRIHHHGPNASRRFGLEDGLALDDLPFGTLVEREVDHVAVARDRRVGAHELQKRDRHAVTVGNGRLLDRAPGLGGAKPSRRGAGKADRHGSAEAELRIHVAQDLRRNFEGDLDGADVGASRHDLRYGEKAVVVNVPDRTVADRRHRRDDPHVERLGDRKGLHGRARLELVGDRAVANEVELDPRLVVRIVGGRIDERENLARPDVRDDDRPRLRFGVLDGRVEGVVGDELNARVDGKQDVLPRTGFDRPDVVDHASEAVANHAAHPLFPAQRAVHGKFHAFLTVVFGVGEAHDVRKHGAVGIKAPHFGRDADAGNAELAHGFRGRDAFAAREIDEVRRGRMLEFAAKRRVRHA